jgi:hypothetical protein
MSGKIIRRFFTMIVEKSFDGSFRIKGKHYRIFFAY